MGSLARRCLDIVAAPTGDETASDALPGPVPTDEVFTMKRTLQRAVLLSAFVLAPLGAMAQSTDGNGQVPIPGGPTNTVPEPGSLALAGMALGLSIGLRVRRARRRAQIKAD
jgi:hypothetical protein